MMERLKASLLLILLLPVALSQSTTYFIETKWNGEDIDHNPATIELSTEATTGNLVIAASAPFFNSPAYGKTLTTSPCPRRSDPDLYNYEVNIVCTTVVSFPFYHLMFAGYWHDFSQR